MQSKFMGQYYSDSLSARNLERCYEIVSPRIRKYLDAEMEFVQKALKPSDRVLELGCGYGRVLGGLGKASNIVVGIDISLGSLRYGREKDLTLSSIGLLQMTAELTAFRDDSFDVVVCIQNGISAFKVDPVSLVRESLRLAGPGGKAVFSTYSDMIWEERLDWFRLQAEEGLLGEIDWEKTKRGTIVCRDGFVATTFTEKDFHEIADEIGVSCETKEVDASSLFGIFRRT